MEETEVDALAIAVGTVHGLYKGEPILDLSRLAQIAKKSRFLLRCTAVPGCRTI